MARRLPLILNVCSKVPLNSRCFPFVVVSLQPAPPVIRLPFFMVDSSRSPIVRSIVLVCPNDTMKCHVYQDLGHVGVLCCNTTRMTRPAVNDQEGELSEFLSSGRWGHNNEQSESGCWPMTDHTVFLQTRSPSRIALPHCNSTFTS
jgi:hypothetical protein